MFKKFFNCQNKRGVTFVEAIVGIFLVLIAFAGLFQIFSFGYFRVKGVRNRLSAIHFCQAKMEAVLNLPYSYLADYPLEPEEVIIDYGQNYSATEDDLIGTRTLEIEDWVVEEEVEGEVAETTIGKRISITVSWKWRRNKIFKEKLVTAVYDGHNE